MASPKNSHRPKNPHRPQELKHLAVQIATMLPRDPSEAREVLRLARRIVDEFLVADGAEAEVVPLQPKPRPDPA